MTNLLLLAIIALYLFDRRRLSRRLSSIERSMRPPVFALLLSASELRAQPKIDLMGPPQPVTIGRELSPADIQALALSDLHRTVTLPNGKQVAAFSAEQKLFIRYIWIRDGARESWQSVALTLNRISRSTRIFQPVVLANGHLVRVNLIDLCNDIDIDLGEITATWEQLRFEPAFNLLLKPAQLKVVLGLPEIQQPLALVRVDNRFEERSLKSLGESIVVRLNAKHLDPVVTLALQTETLSAAPVVTKEYFEKRSLESIKGRINGKDTPYTVIWGGLYYDFKGIKKSPKKGQTDLDFLLERLGANTPATAEQRIGILRSKVTERSRQVEFRPATNIRVGDGQGAVVITYDTFQESIDDDQHALETLDPRFFKIDGHEVIFVGNNGLNVYVAYDGKGNLVEEVPFNLAPDTTIPGGHPKRLQPGISCMRCHEAEGSDGWKGARNDVQRYIDKGLNIFGDAKDPNRLTLKTVLDLGKRYAGDPEAFLTTARLNQQRATVRATGLWTGKPTDVVKVAATKLKQDYAAYWYDEVTTQKALLELGWKIVPADAAQPIMERLVPPDFDGQAFGITPENVRIFALRIGDPLTRNDFATVYPFLQFRANRELGRLAVELGPEPRVRP